jgi:starch synthase
VPPHGVRVLCRTAADLVRHSHALTTSRILADVPAPKRPLETSSTTVDLTMRSMWVRSSRICELYPRIHKRRLANGRCEGKGRFLREFGVADFDDIRRSDIRTDTLQLRGVWSSKQLGFVPEVPEGMAGSCISHVMVASELGTNEDLKRFIHLAHEMGHKVVLDLIPIHASIDSALLAKHPEYFVSMEADVENPDTIPDDHFPYYDAKGRLFWVARAGDGVEEGTRSRKSVQLDLSKQIVRDLLVATAVRLVTEFDVDGLHVDATYVPLNKVFEQRWGLAMPETEILAEVAAAVKSMKASTALIVEAHDDTREVSRIGVDLVYNKSWYNAMRSRGPDRIRRALEKTAYLNWQQGCAGGLQFISHRSEVSPPKAFGAFVQGACILTAFLPTAQLSYYAGTSQNGKDHAHNHIYRDAAAFYSRNASVRMEVLGGEGDPWVSYILRGSNEDLLIAANPTGWPIDVSAQESLCLHLQPGEGQTVRISSWKLESSRVVVGLQQLMCAPRVTDELTGIDNINIDRPVNHTMRKNRPTRVNTGVPLSILMVAPEAAPFIKTGGLADVVSELTRKMADQGHIVKLVLPYYTGLKAPQALEAAGEFEAVTGAGRRTHKLYRSKIGGAELLLIEDHELFNIQTPYDKAPAPNYDTGTIGTADPMEEMGEDQRKAYELGEIRFIHFSYAALAAAKSLNFCPDVVHVHDWATALIPILLKASSDLFFAQTASVLTIHNMAWQGWITPKTLRITGLWDMEQARAALEFTSTFGNHGFSLLKGGIATADKVNAVSQTYAKEICSSQEFGMGLETILEGRGEDLTGVVNGLDMDLWDPATDPEVQFHYSTLTEADYQKRKNKMALQREGKLNVDPEVLLFGVTARLDRQKGLDLVTAVIPEIVRRGGQFALAGNGSPELHAAFERLRESFPANVYAPLVFDEKLARRIHSASDFYLGPSRFEPCGLSQQQAMRYGSVPICSATGGHLDTVEDYWADPTLGTGLFLTQLSEQGMLDAVEKAFILYGQRAHYLRARSHGMERDVSWDLAAHDYAEIYREAMKKQTHAMLPAVAACVSK